MSVILPRSRHHRRNQHWRSELSHRGRIQSVGNLGEQLSRDTEPVGEEQRERRGASEACKFRRVSMVSSAISTPMRRVIDAILDAAPGPRTVTRGPSGELRRSFQLPLIDGRLTSATANCVPVLLRGKQAAPAHLDA